MESDVEVRTGKEAVDLVLDAEDMGKQSIVFVNSKRSAEACSDRVAKNLDLKRKKKLEKISDDILNALSSPTKQCKRLAKNVKRGCAFHHSGLNHKQRELVEDAFKEGLIRCICATPTLAAGLSMPAFRVVIRDLKRFTGGWGMQYIPVLEYHQMAGRAGRPEYDDEGQAITVCKNDEDYEEILDKYIHGDPEDILSKLSAEPVLRTYVLSLIASRFVGSDDELFSFMKETFYAHQYGNIEDLERQIGSVKEKLKGWDFVEGETKDTKGFVTASELDEKELLKSTDLGKRVSELYLDPLTANNLIERMKRGKGESLTDFSVLHMIAYTLELKPFFRVRKKDQDMVDSKLIEQHEYLLCEEPNRFSDEYEPFLNSVKTAMVLEEWIDEVGEEDLYSKYGVRPGGLYSKIERGDWLLYSCYEMCNILGFKEWKKTLRKMRIRLKNGVREELLPLLKLKGIGRVRSRRLYSNGVKDLGDVKRIDVTSLAELLGKKTALKVKEQVGQDLDPDDVEVKKNKRKGQINLDDFT